jgi:hypothetical protein
MATIIIRNSTGSGAVPSSLVQGELAINTVDGKLFYGSGSGNVVKEFTANSSSFATSASYATQAGNAATIDIYSFSSPVESYLLMSNVVATTGVAVGGDTDLRYNSSTNKLTVGSVSATSFTGSLIGTASWATNAITASIAGTAVSADTAKAILTVVNATNADFYPTFVDSNNSPTAASENVYTSNRITFNPSTQLLTVPRIFSTAITASTFTGSLTGSLLGTASYAVQALSASWAPSVASNPFPYTGSAIISGSLVVTGSLRVGVPGVNNPAIDTTVGTLSRGTQAKVDWVNAYLNNSSAVTTVDWENAFLNDGNAITRVDWGNGALNDSAGTMVFDWESRRMMDVAGARSADFDTRFLIYPNGTTAAINYGTQGQIAMTGSVSITGSLTVSGSSTFTNIGPAIFSGSVDISNGNKLTINATGGDEGGEILLGKAVTNTTLTGSGVTVDVYQDKVRIFEQGGNNRGGYFNIAGLGAGVATNLSPIRNIQDVTDGTAVTGTTSGTLTKSILIPANTVGVGDVLYIKARARKTGTAGTLVVRMYINTSAAIGGSLIATSATNAATTVYHQYTRTAVVKTTTNTETMAGNFNVNADDNTTSTAAVSANNIDWTVNQYLVIVHTNSSTADSSVNSFGHIQINKA